MRRYLTLRQVAERLGKTPHWMYRNLARLVAAHGFPARDAAMSGWDELAITGWQNARLPAGMREALGLTTPPPLLLEVASALSRGEDVDVAAELDRRARALFKEAS